MTSRTQRATEDDEGNERDAEGNERVAEGNKRDAETRGEPT